MEHPDYIEKLATKLETKWPSIRKAIERTRSEKKKIETLFDSNAFPYSSSDTSIVVFGSIAREEYTSEKSDVDWTFLIDGQADPAHFHIAREIREKLEDADYKKPGPTDVFGNMTYSHDLIHYIGGEQDTNSNITKRMLLLLESVTIGRPEARKRVVELILERYLSEETRLVKVETKSYKVPHFLLNDVVRYWRTMAVDFATKQRDRQGEGWGLRNTKLRFSRKLLFVAGLLMCYAYQKVSPVLEDGQDVQKQYNPLLRCILDEHVSLTPLQVLARELIELKAMEAGGQIFGAYEEFLAILADEDKRKILKSLTPERAAGDSLYKEVSGYGREFGEGIEKFFFDTHELCHYTRKYGVF